MTKNAATIAIGIRLATTRPVSTPRNSSITSVTISTAWIRLLWKSSIFLATTSGWNRTKSKSTPIG